MPIRPENKARYPADWIIIRATILERAGHKCEGCGVPNHWLITRNPDGTWNDAGRAGTAATRIMRRCGTGAR
jgi:hypothetical protein